MNINHNKEIKMIPLWQSFLFFIIPAIGIMIAWKFGIPFFKNMGLPQNVGYMICMTLVFLPLLIASVIAFLYESK